VYHCHTNVADRITPENEIPARSGVTEGSVPDLARVQYDIPLIAEQYRILLDLPARKADNKGKPVIRLWNSATTAMDAGTRI